MTQRRDSERVREMQERDNMRVRESECVSEKRESEESQLIKGNFSLDEKLN